MAQVPPVDRLRTLLDVVVDSIDQPGVTGAQLARRGHLSRFHFDRLIAAATGEAPGAFRRRLLLERAAHELRGGGKPVGDVALSAGYGSPEAFSRTFHRSFGVSPSEVKRHPPTTVLHVDAPNGIHFHPPGGMKMPPYQRRTAMDVLNRMLEHDVWITGEMLARADGFDDATLDGPIETNSDGTTLREILTHLVWQKEMWAAAVEGREAPDSAPAPIAELRVRLAEAGPRFLALTRRALQDGRTDETFIDATCDPPHTFTIGGMIAHVLTFSAYRRTVALETMRADGITDLGYGDPMGFVAEHT